MRPRGYGNVTYALLRRQVTKLCCCSERGRGQRELGYHGRQSWVATGKQAGGVRPGFARSTSFRPGARWLSSSTVFHIFPLTHVDSRAPPNVRFRPLWTPRRGDQLRCASAASLRGRADRQHVGSQAGPDVLQGTFNLYAHWQPKTAVRLLKAVNELWLEGLLLRFVVDLCNKSATSLQVARATNAH